MRSFCFTLLAFFLIPNASADTEDNDTWQTALPFPQDRTVAGTQSDDDWYVINAVVGNRILMDLTFTDSDGNIDVALYDNAGNPDPNFPGTLRDFSQTTGDHELVDADISGRGPGTYYIRVYGGAGGDQGNSYTLTWTEMGADDDFEENDIITSPAAVTESAVAFGSKNDSDWYSIEVASGGAGTRVIASLRFEASADLDLELRDSGGTLLASSETNGAGVNEAIDYDVGSSGTYRLSLVDNSNTGDGYALTWAAVGSGASDFPVPDVNDVPVATANTVSTPVNTAYTFAATDLTFTDSEGDGLVSATITNLSLGGGTLAHSSGTALNNGDTLTAAQLGTLVYTPPANVTGSPLATFDFTVNDIDAGIVSAQMDIDVTDTSTPTPTPAPTTTPAPTGGGSSGSVSLIWLFALVLVGVARRIQR